VKVRDDRRAAHTLTDAASGIANLHTLTTGRLTIGLW